MHDFSGQPELEVALKLVHSTDAEWPSFFEQLRRHRQLSRAIREINGLLASEATRPLAVAALQRMGLWH